MPYERSALVCISAHRVNEELSIFDGEGSV